MIQNKTILLGDVLEKLRQLPEGFFNTIVSSPPYWGLRDYGVVGQWGNELNFNDYLEKMRLFMSECKRILRSDGVCWINLGDTYNSQTNHIKDKYNNHEYMNTKHAFREGIQKKSLFGIPQRFYINCIDSGWVARNLIIWNKPNAMPNSVKDRFSNSYEVIMFFTKSPKYYFDLDPIRVTPKTQTKPFNIRIREAMSGKANEKMGESDKTYRCSDQERINYDKNGVRKQDNIIMGNGKIDVTKKGFNERWKKRKWDGVGGQTQQSFLRNTNISGKNPSDVWGINTKPFRGAHFATYPPDLIERILKCSCPKNGWVLDPFMGSGTTGLVAERLNLNWMGIELKPEYVDLAYKRIFKIKK